MAKQASKSYKDIQHNICCDLEERFFFFVPPFTFRLILPKLQFPNQVF